MSSEIVVPGPNGDELATPAPGDGGGGRPPADRVAGEFLSAYRGNTLNAYRRDLHEWFDLCRLFDTDPLDASRPHVQAWVAMLHGEKKRAASTIARKISAVSGFYRYAVDEQHLARSPVPSDRRRLNLPAVSRESATIGPDLATAKALVVAAEQRGARDRAIMLTLLSTAMRVSELTALDLADMGVHDARRYVTITRKGGRRQRLPLVPDAAAAVDEYLDQRWAQGVLLPALSGPASAAPLFADADGHRMTRRAVRWLIDVCARETGHRDPGPHWVRHGAATFMLEDGRDIREVQRALGHQDPKTTIRYAHEAEALSKSPLLALDGKFT